jgi:hypothetical protein
MLMEDIQVTLTWCLLLLAWPGQGALGAHD